MIPRQLSDWLTATFESTMSSDDESPFQRFIKHEDTPWTSIDLGNRGLAAVDLNYASSTATTSVGSSPAAVFSSRGPSIATKPTSYGTGYPPSGRHKEYTVDTTYAASLSATHGSGSEAEADHDDALGATLVGAGAWSSSRQAQGQLLRRPEHAKVRLSRSLPHRVKKPVVVLHQSTDPPSNNKSKESPLQEPALLF